MIREKAKPIVRALNNASIGLCPREQSMPARGSAKKRIMSKKGKQKKWRKNVFDVQPCNKSETLRAAY